MVEQLRTRRQTRATVLTSLAASGGLFRPRLAEACRLTEASISRIVAELREEALVEELRRPAPYPGGPTHLVTLRKDQFVAGLDFANDRLAIGVGSLVGELVRVERFSLPPAAGAATVGRVVAVAVSTLRDWCEQHRIVPRRIAASIPGFRGIAGPANPIIALDHAALQRRLTGAFPGVPIVVANAIAAHAAAHLHGPDRAALGLPHLFVHFGHGVGGAWVQPEVTGDPIRPVEIGHVVLDATGPSCRCGHQGCLEASASTTAVAALFDLAEADILDAGDEWPKLARLTPRREAALRTVLFRCGLVIGNALNLGPVPLVALSGWPTGLPGPLRGALLEGIDRSLFGGFAATPVAVRFLQAAQGGAPNAALAYALHDLVRDGGLPSSTEIAATRRVVG